MQELCASLAERNTTGTSTPCDTHRVVAGLLGYLQALQRGRSQLQHDDHDDCECTLQDEQVVASLRSWQDVLAALVQDTSAQSVQSTGWAPGGVSALTGCASLAPGSRRLAAGGVPAPCADNAPADHPPALAVKPVYECGLNTAYSSSTTVPLQDTQRASYNLTSRFGNRACASAPCPQMDLDFHMQPKATDPLTDTQVDTTMTSDCDFPADVPDNCDCIEHDARQLWTWLVGPSVTLADPDYILDLLFETLLTKTPIAAERCVATRATVTHISCSGQVAWSSHTWSIQHKRLLSATRQHCLPLAL